MCFAVINGGDALEELIQPRKKIIGFVDSFILFFFFKVKNKRGISRENMGLFVHQPF